MDKVYLDKNGKEVIPQVIRPGKRGKKRRTKLKIKSDNIDYRKCQSIILKIIKTDLTKFDNNKISLVYKKYLVAINNYKDRYGKLGYIFGKEVYKFKKDLEQMLLVV